MSAIPYAATLGRLDPQQVIAQTPARLAGLFEGLSTEQTEARPAPGKWNLREVMAHLADCEIAWGWRLRQAMSEDHALLQPFDQDGWAKPYAAYSMESAKATYFALRAWNVALIAALTETDKTKMYTHPERGEERLWTIVEIMAGHDLHHLAILELSIPGQR
jgi:uncharacterized damage-inducible protein DinB